MSIGSRFTHTVDIIRQGATGTADDYNHPITADQILETVKVAIQPLSAEEAALISQGGAASSDHRIYMFPTDLSTADAILHVKSVCPVVNDLPTGRFEITGVPNAAGLGHHLEVAAHLVMSPEEAEGS